MSLKDAIRNWDIEVDAEAEKLIRGGMPPYDAIKQAQKNVSAQRNGGYCDRKEPYTR